MAAQGDYIIKSNALGRNSFAKNGYVFGDNSIVGSKEKTDVDKINEILENLKKLNEDKEKLEKKLKNTTDTEEQAKLRIEIAKKGLEITKEENELLGIVSEGGNNSYVIGNKTTTLGDNSFTIGDKSFTKGDKTYSLGDENKVYGDNNLVFGLNNTIVFGDNSTPVTNAVSIGYKGNERQIKFVAERKDGTDAINGSQLFKELGGKLNLDGSNLTNDSKASLIGKLSEDASIENPKKVLVTDKQVKEYLNRNMNNIKEAMDKLNSKADLALSGVSSAVTMANLPNLNDGKFNLAASYGYYGGSHSLAVGFSGTNDSRNFVYKLSGAVNDKGNIAFGVGAGITFGSEKTEVKKLKETVKKQRDKISNLEKKLDEVLKLIKK